LPSKKHYTNFKRKERAMTIGQESIPRITIGRQVKGKLLGTNMS